MLGGYGHACAIFPIYFGKKNNRKMVLAFNFFEGILEFLCCEETP